MNCTQSIACEKLQKTLWGQNFKFAYDRKIYKKKK